jgi:hypothetical protein
MQQLISSTPQTGDGVTSGLSGMQQMRTTAQ